MEERLGADQVPLFEDLDTLLGGQLRDFNPESKGSITQEIKIGRKRYSYEFTAGLIANGKTTSALLLGVDKSDVLKAEAKLTSYVSIIEENNRELQRLANTDPLTGTANRRALFNRFQELTQQLPDFHCTVSILVTHAMRARHLLSKKYQQVADADPKRQQDACKMQTLECGCPAFIPRAVGTGNQHIGH